MKPLPTLLALTLASVLPLAASAAEPAPAQVGPGAATQPPMFSELDRDHDGQLSREEAAAAPQVDAAFEKLDGDHDGRLSLAEWNSGAKSRLRATP